jgi:hypothetical protein
MARDAADIMAAMKSGIAVNIPPPTSGPMVRVRSPSPPAKPPSTTKMPKNGTAT